MALDPITAVANATTGLANIVKPYIDDHLAQKYEEEFKERISEGTKALDSGDPKRINDYVVRLLSEAGFVAGGDMGENISVPLACLRDFFSISAAKIKGDQRLANLQFERIEK